VLVLVLVLALWPPRPAGPSPDASGSTPGEDWAWGWTGKSLAGREAGCCAGGGAEAQLKDGDCREPELQWAPALPVSGTLKAPALTETSAARSS
jgi:hypothetical protein